MSSLRPLQPIRPRSHLRCPPMKAQQFSESIVSFDYNLSRRTNYQTYLDAPFVFHKILLEELGGVDVRRTKCKLAQFSLYIIMLTWPGWGHSVDFAHLSRSPPHRTSDSICSARYPNKARHWRRYWGGTFWR